MVQHSSPTVAPNFSSMGAALTPPNSPILAPKKCLRKKAQDLVATLGGSRAYTPRKSPEIHPSQNIQPLQLHQKLLEAQSNGSAALDSAMPNAEEGIQMEDAVTERLKDYKAVNEVWDRREYNYVLREASGRVCDVSELEQYVFVVRKRVDKNTTATTVYIDIKSIYLREILRVVLQDVRGISLKEYQPSIEQNLLYLYLKTLEECQIWHSDDRDNMRASEDLLPLVDYLRATYATFTQRLWSLLQNDEITYDTLWALFKPNDLVYTTYFGKSRCFKYSHGEEKKAREGTKYWSIEGQYLDFDGEGFGEVLIQLKIPEFRGARKIDLLDAFPLQYHPDSNNVHADLLKLGQKFISLKGTHHRYYRGTAFSMDKGHPIEVTVDSRIMIDAAFFKKMNPNYLRPHVIKPFDIMDSNAGIWFLSDNPAMSELTPTATGRFGIELMDMLEDDLLTCSPTVLGFSFNDKLWAEFAVDAIEFARWTPWPYDCLAISDDQKEVIMALAEKRTVQLGRPGADNFITGKGRGLNLLLHGPPGVGKTLTAEAVSEHLRQPFFSISVGELPQVAGQLEVELSRIFEIVNHWGAVLLLDEADIYLERYSAHDIVRNSLVSVFLRKLECCEGIIFLTSNRVREFDEAVLSRIHLTLRYDDLNSDTKKKIWCRFLTMACSKQGAVDINSRDLGVLVNSKLNGRQIKNAVATACVLADRAGRKVCFSYLQQAVEASECFMKEFSRADGTSN